MITRKRNREEEYDKGGSQQPARTECKQGGGPETVGQDFERDPRNHDNRAVRVDEEGDYEGRNLSSKGNMSLTNATALA